MVEEKYEQAFKIKSLTKIVRPYKQATINYSKSLIGLNIFDRDLQDAGFWLKFALKLNENTDQPNVAQTLVILAKYCSLSQQFIKGEGLFRTVFDFLQNVTCNSFSF